MIIGIIIHHNGVFNIYNGLTKSAWYETGLTEAELVERIMECGANQLNRSFFRQVEDAILKGTSNGSHESLAETILDNEHNLSLEAFKTRYLTVVPQSLQPNKSLLVNKIEFSDLLYDLRNIIFDSTNATADGNLDNALYRYFENKSVILNIEEK